ncbi:hypothetical protein [Dendrosporobacter sp. 1207_IL3150]|uniref:hypothetical protein n=1 Tax=Dendrosporobacter sp. 1207_IL3150 TaxID=3084054 RepID=UPI002FDAC1DA
MREFVLKTVLFYEYMDGSEFKREINYEFTPFCFEDIVNGCKIEIHPNFSINIKGLVCETANEALLKSYDIIEFVCRAVTITLQMQNYDNREFQPNVSFKKSEVEIVSDRLLVMDNNKIIKNKIANHYNLLIKEQFSASDRIASMRISQGLNLSNIDLLYKSYTIGGITSIYIDTIFRALRSRDVESKYFTLFTIIERIETTFQKDENLAKSLFNCEQQNALLAKLKPQITDILGGDNEYCQRVYNRLSQIIKTSTIKTRYEKLCAILNDKFDICEISKGLMKFNVDNEKAKCFIDTRNGLFHGKNVDKDAHNKLVQLTNELLELCLKILELELKRV